MAEQTSFSAAQQRVIRVFVSFTFWDMHAEREVLTRQIFSQLCEPGGRYAVVDHRAFRWQGPRRNRGPLRRGNPRSASATEIRGPALLLLRSHRGGYLAFRRNTAGACLQTNTQHSDPARLNGLPGTYCSGEFDGAAGLAGVLPAGRGPGKI